EAESRKRRRLRSLLAVAATLLLLLGGGAGLWYVQQRALLRQDGTRELGAAQSALESGRLAEAHSALGRAEAVLSGRGHAHLQRRLEQLSNLLGWATELDRIRQDRWAVIEGKFSMRAGAPRYARSFAAHGLTVGQLDAEEVAAAVRASPIRAALIDALDDWRS